MPKKIHIIMDNKTQIILFFVLFFFIAVIIGWQIFSTLQLYGRIAELNSQLKGVSTFAKKLDGDMTRLDGEIAGKMTAASATYITTVNNLKKDIQTLKDSDSQLREEIGRAFDAADAAMDYAHRRDNIPGL